jgi:pyocin large subunit-like protein
MVGLKTALVTALGMSAAMLLSSCDNGPSAVAGGKQAAGTQMASASAPISSSASRYSSSSDDAAQVDHRKDPVTLVNGKPVWAASRKYTADNSAQYAFEHHGDDFAAKSLDQYVQKAHAFVEHPPKSAETLTRGNGDTLIYDAKSNVFAVANKDGAPRTMFKPNDGATYWQQQKDRLAKQASYASRKSHNSDDSEG